MLRSISCSGFLTAACLIASVDTARCDAPNLADRFASEPGDSLIRQWEAGPGFSMLPAGATAARWKVDASGPDRWEATDEATGVTIVRSYRRPAERNLLVIETTLINRAAQVQKFGEAAIADLTFRLRDPQDEGYAKLSYRNDVWYDSTYWTGPDWTRVGKNWHHPGTNTPSVRRFTAPRDGRVTITGRAFKLHKAKSDGVRLAIRHGRETVWQAEIDGEDDQGVEASVAIDVRAGDALRFVVHKRGQISCDTTHWDPAITYDDGTRFQASESFSTTKQGMGGWSYEMETGDPSQAGLPQVHCFSRSFLLCRLPLGPERPVTADSAKSLPIVLVGDGRGETGVVLAVAGEAPWRFQAALDGAERLRLTWTVHDPSGSFALGPGASLALPDVVVGSYSGAWPAGMARLRPLMARQEKAPETATRTSAALRSQSPFAEALGRVAEMLGEPIELDLWLMLQAEWREEDELDETAPVYAEATARHIQRTGRLLADLQAEHGRHFLAGESATLDRLAESADLAGSDVDAHRLVYQQVRLLKRRIALSNPLTRFGKMLFCKRVPTSYSHLVMQYYGWRARPGGGLFVLDRPGRSLACRDLLDGRLEGGCVLEPRLSYDAERIVFSYVDCAKQFDPDEILNDADEGFYHVWEVNGDGTGLRQLTSGPYDDLMPTYLPDGGIVFSSTRRQGYARCFGRQFSRRWHVYTLHRMDADGGNLRKLSVHDTNEWFPAVSHAGLVLYARWDYIDRDAVTHQNLWATRPDGTNPFALWGNATSSPHCTFQLQPIPNSPKIVFAASAHHSIAGGSIAVVDPTVAVDGHEAITRITPAIPFPEAEGRDIPRYYTAPWPLSEKYFLVGYSPRPLVWEPGANERNALGIYLLDAWGNRELIYRDPDIGSTNPCPLRPRPAPPIVAGELAAHEPTGEIVLADVYEGLGGVPRGTIQQLRIVQLFPKTTHVADSPPIGMAREENGRAILGTVPVEPDGSARFVVPAHKPLYFQALDADGFAYQTMRTLTYVQRGERVSCVGCHEHRRSAPLRRAADLAALRRPPSPIEPGALGGRPFSYVEVVQPVLDKHCTKCHGADDPDGGLDLTGTPHGQYTRSYVALMGDVDFWHHGTNPDNAAKALVPRFGGRNQVEITPPGGLYGALGSRLMRRLREGHEDVDLSADELARLAAWIDLNAIFYGVNPPDEQAKQRAGEVVAMPEIQ